MTHIEKERDTRSEGISVTWEASGGETKSVQESADEDITRVDEVEVKVIKRRKSYNISFQLGVFISYEEMN